MRLIRIIFVAALFPALAAVAQGQGEGPGPRGGPPPEAIAACEGKSAGAACSWSHGEHTIEGTCFTPAADKPLACRPNHPPPRQGS